ncbi:hypothetical protein Q7P37_005367 [Cladosporium fusiforme]
MLSKAETQRQLWQEAWDMLSDSGLSGNDIRQVLIEKPHSTEKASPSKQQSKGEELFRPVTAPRMHREILPGSVPLIPLGGVTWLQEIAIEPQGAVASWTGDLERAHVAATEVMAQLLDSHYGREHHLFPADADCIWPSGLSDAEQFYSLRDTINYVEQWLPGDCVRHPALVGILGVAVAIDECLIFSKDIPGTRFLGRTVLEWESMVRKEVQEKGGDSHWLDLAFSALYGCICLQNLEKAMLGGIEGVKTASMDWHSLEGYFTRSEIALTSTSGFFIAAYSCAPYHEQYVRPLSVGAASNVVILDLSKRASGHGGGSVTEVDLGGDAGVEIRMRAHLINRIFSYACERLPASLTFASYRFWQSTSAMLLLNDRYVERRTRTRAAVPEASLKKMEDIMRLTGGSIRIPLTGGTGTPLVVGPQGTGGETELGGWQSAKESKSHATPTQSVNEDVAPLHTPAVWFKALNANRHCDSTLGETNHGHRATADGGDGSTFKSLLELVPAASISAAQDLESVFDGCAYLGRPIASCPS